MPAAKSSRKGKKAWRKNIDTTEVQDYLQQQRADEIQGTAVSHLDDEQLFFEDKEPSTAEAAAVTAQRSTKRRKEKKLLRCQAIINAVHAAKPINAAATKRRVKHAATPKPGSVTAPRDKAAAVVAVKSQHAQQQPQQDGTDVNDVWAADGSSADEPAYDEEACKQPRRRRVRPKHSAIPAVEIDAPGCSYNPDQELHQEAVAQAVALELQKQYRQELQPKAPPSLVPHIDAMESDELALLQTMEQLEDESDDAADARDGDDATDAIVRKRALERKTKSQRNKERRRKEVDSELQRRQQLKAQRRQIDSLNAIAAEIAQHEEQRAAARLRNQVVQQEREMNEPPKLGKIRFQPEPPAVLTSDELHGTLRKLHGHNMLTRDRFKSIQKRGIIEPRLPAPKRMKKKRKEITLGSGTAKLIKGQEEIREMVKARQKRKASM